MDVLCSFPFFTGVLTNSKSVVVTESNRSTYCVHTPFPGDYSEKHIQTEWQCKTQRTLALMSVVSFRVKRHTDTGRDWRWHLVISYSQSMFLDYYYVTVRKQIRRFNKKQSCFTFNKAKMILCQHDTEGQLSDGESYSGLHPSRRSGWTPRWGRRDRGQRWGWSGTRTCPGLCRKQVIQYAVSRHVSCMHENSPLFTDIIFFWELFQGFKSTW